VGIDFGKDTLTDSGYPKFTKTWKRGTALSDAKTVFSGKQSDVGVWPWVTNTKDRQYAFITQSDTFFTSQTYYFSRGQTTKLQLPNDIDIEGIFKNQLLLKLQSDWDINNKLYKQGALISINFDDFLNGKRNFAPIYEPDELNNVRGELYQYKLVNGKWDSQQIKTPKLGTLTIVSTDGNSDQFFYAYEGFLSPTSLYLVDNMGKQKKIRGLSHFFDAR